MTDLLIIGGSDAGISAALRAKEIDPEIRPTVVVADRYPNFSICGLPFFLSGEVAHWQELAHRTQHRIEQQGINLLPAHKATAIHPEERFVSIEDSRARLLQLNYDKLIIATGATAVPPQQIQGLDKKGVFLLRYMDHALAFNTYIDEYTPKDIVIIGAGYIGMEMADAMRKKGLEVTLIETAPGVLTTMDPDLGALVQKELENQNVRVHTNVQVHNIERLGAGLLIKGNDNYRIATDMVLVATGSRPQSDLAVGCGIKTGLQEAICVTRKMETSLPHIFAAGDCAETWHQLLSSATYLPLGTTAHKQGRVAGENAAGGNKEFLGTLGSQVVKVFNLVAARTGLNAAEASAAGFDVFTADWETWDHAPYYPGASRILIRFTGDRTTHHLLGAQSIGAFHAEISKRIDVLATAIYNEMTIDSLNDLDLSYTPPLSTPWDPIQITAQKWLMQCHGKQDGSSKRAGRTASGFHVNAPLFLNTPKKK